MLGSGKRLAQRGKKTVINVMRMMILMRETVINVMNMMILMRETVINVMNMMILMSEDKREEPA